MNDGVIDDRRVNDPCQKSMDLDATDEHLADSEVDMSVLMEELEMAENLLSKLEDQVHCIEDHISELLKSDN